MNGVYFAALVALPALAAVLLLGPLRKKEHREVLKVYAAFALGGLLAAAILTLTRPEGWTWTYAAALAALMVAPLSGAFLALRIELVRADRRAAWVFLPLGWLAGCAVAVQVLYSLGFGGGP